MHINWIIFGIAAVVLLSMIIICCERYHRHKRAKCKVRQRSDQEKMRDINEALKPFGFAYHLRKDIFYSLEDAWQRDFGYGRLYDEMAPVMNMVIHSEPIYFEYGNRRWMIEFWKGQYGIATGAEVGIYVEKERGGEEDPAKVFYQCVPPEEELPVSMILYKNGKRIFQREKRHWWLTGFFLGEFSWPSELMLEVSLTFSDLEMLEAFLEGCYRAGYREEDLHIWYRRVSFRLYQPKSEQPSKYGKIFGRWVQWQNRHNCRLYQRVTRDFTRTVDKLDYLLQAYPRIFGIIIKTGRIAWGKKKHGPYCKKTGSGV
ncbi:DUF4474 domain-containing protein [Lachnospiraceae bacterium 45-W7]